MTPSPLAAAWAAAWLEGLRRVSPCEDPPDVDRAEDTGRPPIAPLRPTGGPQ